MTGLTTDRRHFLKASGAAATALSLKYMVPTDALAATPPPVAYGAWEDVMRRKWTWDRVVRGSRGINCTGHCAFNIYVKNGIVWREEQQGEYGRSGDDTPDYGPRGCQKGNRHSKYMYGKQRALYPMKRVGERGEGKWARISWDQAISEIADKVIEHATTSGPDAITFAMGTQMILKRGAFSALFRFANVTGIVVPETFAGVGDLPVGAYMTLGYELPGDNMAAVYKSKCCLVWACNPAATRIPDAHFFWEAKYNGTDVITISPDFNATAIHSSRWLNPKPGTDAALALAVGRKFQVIKRQEFLGDEQMLIGAGGHLRRMRHGHHLHPLGEPCEARADGVRHRAADPGIDLVEHQRRRRALVRQHHLER
jgi:nitrate reductase alpha subunit